MGNQTDYFNRTGYKGQYEIGDRVIGSYKGIPFVGSVGNDTLINYEIGPQISIHLDLPMRLTDGLKSFIIVAHKDVRPLKEIK